MPPSNDRRPQTVIIQTGGRRRVVVLPAQRSFDDGDYDVAVEMDLRGETIECTRIEVCQKPNGPPVGSQNLRRIPLRRYQQLTVVAATNADGWPMPDSAAAEVDDMTQRRRPGSPPVADEDLALAARLYRRAKKKNPRRALVLTQQWLAEHDKHVSRSTVHAWIKKAEAQKRDRRSQ